MNREKPYLSGFERHLGPLSIICNLGGFEFTKIREVMTNQCNFS